MVRPVIFAMVESRPDIAFAVSIVSKFAKNPSTAHVEAVKMIIYYLNTTKTRRITYKGIRSNLDLIKYLDLDWEKDQKHKNLQLDMSLC